jgi:MerR family mercuric resistance operon transcriptional regulator
VIAELDGLVDVRGFGGQGRGVAEQIADAVDVLPLAEPPRRRSGYRQYPRDTVRRLRFIRRAKELGFTLKEIGELLDLRVDPAKSCADVRALTKAKIADVEAKMGDLARIQAALEELARACRGKGPTSECPILDALDDQENAHGSR